MASITLIRALTFVLILLGSGSLVACNTLEGAGEDLSAAGDAVDDAAEDSTPY